MEVMGVDRSHGAWDDDDVERRVLELYPGLRRFAAAVGAADIDPDDLVQEALVRTMRAVSPDEIGDLGAYLRSAVVRVRSNERRRLGRRRGAIARLVARDVPRDDVPREDVAGSDDAAMALLDALPIKDRAAVYLSVVEGHSHAEVAAVIGGTTGAARSRVSRALHRLREELEREEAADGRAG